MIHFSCPHCQTDLLRSDVEIGQEINCPVCNKPVRVPIKGDTHARASELPWFYGFLEFIAVLIVVFSIIWMIVIIYVAARAKQWFVGVFEGGRVLLAGVTIAALIKLLLDMGRSLRRIRNKSD
jgi:hypothetical protein